MLFRDTIVIDAPADRVWEYVGSPDLWELFHVKASSCKQISAQRGRIGSKYEIVFRMGKRTTPSRCEIIDLRPGSMIQVLSTTSDPARPTTTAKLTYTLENIGSKTKVEERDQIIDPKINIFIRALAWFIFRFGQPAGETTLTKLKRIIEDERRP